MNGYPTLERHRARLRAHQMLAHALTALRQARRENETFNLGLNLPSEKELRDAYEATGLELRQDIIL